MTDTIQDRLQRRATLPGVGAKESRELQAAAAHIDAQDAKIKALVEALQVIANEPENIEPWFLARQAIAAAEETT